MKLETASSARDGSREVEAPDGGSLTREDRRQLLRYMLLMRISEERGLTLYRQGKVPGSFYDGCGQEAISVGAVVRARAARSDVHPASRPRGPFRSRGHPGPLPGQLHGPRGRRHRRQGREHALRRPRSSAASGMVSMLPDMAQVATGMALAFKMRARAAGGDDVLRRGLDGQRPVARGDELRRRPPLPAGLPAGEQPASPTRRRQELEFAVDPVERAGGYGFPGVSVDGNDVEAVFEAAREAAERAREGEGPTLIECHTMRMHGHGAHDDMSYVPRRAVRGVAKRDPIDRYERRLAEEHGFEPASSRGLARSASARYADERPRRRSPRRCPTRRSPPKACSPTASRSPRRRAAPRGRAGRSPTATPRPTRRQRQPEERGMNATDAVAVDHRRGRAR